MKHEHCEFEHLFRDQDTGWPMQIETNFRMIYFTDRKVYF